MSILSDVIHKLNKVYQEVFFTQKEPASIIVPLRAQTLPTDDNYMIFADTSNLPPLETRQFGESTMEGHDLRGEFFYVSEDEPTGRFYLTSAPGLFLIGAHDWVNNGSIDVNIPISLNVSRMNNYQTYSRRIFGFEPAHVFLGSNDNFWITYEPEGEEAVDIDSSELIITRISKNPYYVNSRELGD
jgi:hypothetical protein